MIFCGGGDFLHIKEVVTQGYPLTMILYVIIILPLIMDLQAAHIQVTRPCYDDAGAGGSFAHIENKLEYLMVRDLYQGFFPELTNSNLVLSEQNVQWSKTFFCEMGLKVVTGSCYLEFNIREAMDEGKWLG